ncbi:amidase family protein [Paraclostridium bifermentans]|uniref:amidase family protein n=1 Tax=Paraclostridium bifermentans TaxID=1490 RepID=UPI0006B32BEC|nr:amidase family protein [Paraclostridium bifermentans]
MKKFLKYSLITIIILIVVVAFNFQKIMVKFASFMMEDSVNKQVKMQYDEKKVTKSKNDVNINQFKTELNQMSDLKFKNIEELISNANIKDIQALYDSKKLTCEDLVVYYLKRIEKYDINNLNSIIELNPDVIKIAKEKDQQLRSGNLYGIPITLKANIGTSDKMHTTAGSYALKDSILDEDSFIVKKLREEGAIILGKTNLSEFANYMSTKSSSGFSALGGQTQNPYGKFDVGGSSSGSASSVASGFSVASIGTETAGSIIYPSSQNSVVGIKPSIGLVSRNRIVPIAESQDTAGVISRNVEDAALILNSIYGYDENDKDTIDSKNLNENYINYLNGKSIKGLKVAILKPFAARSNEFDILKRVEQELKDMGSQTQTVSFSNEINNIKMSEALEAGFKFDIAKYLKIAKVNGVNGLKDIIDINKGDLENRAPYGQDLLEKSLSNKMTSEEYKNLVESNKKIASNEINSILKNADVIVSLSNQAATAYAPAGYPALTVPAGYKSSGEPIGITFVGSKFEEGKLLKIANVYENNTKYRKDPNLKY